MDEAIAEFQAALQFNPDDVAAHNNLGAAFVSQKRFDEAIDEYQKVLAIKPEDVTAYNNLGEALYRRAHGRGHRLLREGLGLGVSPE